jgi:hypothetical protein
MRVDLRNRRDALARKFLHSEDGIVWEQAIELANQAIKCGARTQAGTPCQRKGVGRGGRCIKHGGASTGAKTAEGKARQREGYFRWVERKLAEKREAAE